MGVIVQKIAVYECILWISDNYNQNDEWNFLVMKFVTYERTYNIAYVETQSKFKYTMSHTELLKCMTFKLVKQIKQIVAIKK